MNFTTFVKGYLPRYATSPFLDELYSEFRSGLVHAYFPENVDVVAVTKTNPGAPSIWQESGKWRIVVGDFIPELRVAADALKKDVLNGKYLLEFKKAISVSPGMSRITALAPVVGGISASGVATNTSGSILPSPPASPSP